MASKLGRPVEQSDEGQHPESETTQVREERFISFRGSLRSSRGGSTTQHGSLRAISITTEVGERAEPAEA